MRRRRDEGEKTWRRKESYFEGRRREERLGRAQTNRANVLIDALAEKQGLSLRNRASNTLGNAHLRYHHRKHVSARAIAKAF